MTTLTITLDDTTDAGQLARLSCSRPVFDFDAIRANCEEFATEDLALADSDPEHRAELLAYEDGA